MTLEIILAILAAAFLIMAFVVSRQTARCEGMLYREREWRMSAERGEEKALAKLRDLQRRHDELRQYIRNCPETEEGD